MTRRRHPDAIKLDDLAYRFSREAKLCRLLAENTQRAHDHIAQELTVLGWPQRSGSEGRGGSELTTVERDADASYRFTAIREDMRDQVTALIESYEEVCGHLKATGIVIETARRTGLTPAERAALTKPTMSTCSDHQQGKHAADRWGDPLCHLPSVKAGLCSRHYQAWYRARIDDGIDTSRDHEPAG